MKYTHVATGEEYEVGRLMDTDGADYDINVIINSQADDKAGPVELVNYYYGEPSDDDTKFFVDQFLGDKQALTTVLEYAFWQLKINRDFMEASDVNELSAAIGRLEKYVPQRLDNDNELVCLDIIDDTNE